jgi:peptide/nickel transport system substrate-binding protein
MFGLFADTSGYIVPAEVTNGSIVPSASLQPGSGPFRWVEWSERKLASVARNSAWYGGSDRPMLDGVASIYASDATEIEARLRTKELDVAVVGRPAADRLTKAIPGLQEQVAGHAQWFGMRFYLPIAPYNDVRLRTAISIAVDRREMLQKFFAGSGELNPWVSWPLTRWSLPQAELITIPGHRVREVERQADIAEANRLLAASLADHPLPGELELLVPEDIERSLGMGSMIKAQIKKNLDLNIAVNPQPINKIVQRLYYDGTAPWAVGVDTGWLDLDDWMFPQFHTDGPKNSFALRDAEMDSMIVAQRQELDESKRRDIGHAIQRKLLHLNAGVNLVSERVVTLSWPYVKSFPVDIGSGYQNRFADTWLDRSDPNFRGR